MSSSSWSFASENSAFSRYSKYTNKSMCIVPREWKAYPRQTINVMLCSNFASHWDAYKKVEGAVVQIGDVAAKLEYNDKRIWMRRHGDLRNRPHPQEYALTYVDKFEPPRK